ncbi:putative D-2-hydroxyglutarate dehydrogenase, mitochondrial [Nymphon striatum]|nr:putative D-2-hydroxyglutarate dehydrogenase, mitochondrial [Nymphon striatum]
MVLNKWFLPPLVPLITTRLSNLPKPCLAICQPSLCSRWTAASFKGGETRRTKQLEQAHFALGFESPNKMLLGAITLDNIRRGPAQAGTLGYWTGEPFARQGYMREAIHADGASSAAAQVGVVPYGGGTGLVGGQVAPDGPAPLILSLERMNKVRAVHADENVLVAEAGVILADVQAAADDADRLFPLSLAAEGSARIGGNLSTNAGGTGVLRYGNARDLCLGLEAVLPDGQIWNGLTRLRKNNTGYDLRHLLIGAEGTLGIITAAALKLFPKPAHTGTALLVVESPRAALDLLSLAKSQLGEMISAFELIHRQGFEFFPPEWCVLVELGLSGDLDPEAALERLFADAHEAGLVPDGLIAQNAQQAADFWKVREMIPEANRRVGSISSHDISVPLSSIPDFITKGGEIVARIGDFRINCFGHVGDGNLHYNRCTDLVHEMGGSMSAEHGIGRLKVDDLEHYGDPAKLSAMRAIKAALDPKGIMNPGAVLRV